MSKKPADSICRDYDQDFPGFHRLRKEDIELLNPNKKSVCYSAGEVIVKQGTLMDYVFFLNEGYIKKVIETEVNRNILLEVMCPDQFIGLNCINVSDACPASFIALTDCRVCQIRKQHFLKVLLSNEEFNSDVLRISGRESMKLYNKLALFGSRNNHGRLANALLYLDSDQFSQIDIYSQISRKELAELAAISTESMNKILKEFREDLIIEINGKAIRILRPDLLERISRIG